jgi:hypothetical protein
MNKIFAWMGLLAFCLSGCVSKPVSGEKKPVSIEKPLVRQVETGDAADTPGPETIVPLGTYVCFSTDAPFPVSVVDATDLVQALKELDASMAPILKQTEQAGPEVRQEIQKLMQDEVNALTKKLSVARELKRDELVWFTVPAGPRLFTFGKDGKVTVEASEGMTTPVFLKYEGSVGAPQVGTAQPTTMRGNKPYYRAAK